MNPTKALRAAALLLSLLLLAGGGCQCGSAPEDVLDQCQGALDIPPSVSTDILFVIDNSGSMALKQQRVQQQLQTFVENLVNAPVHNDFQIGVVTTGVSRNYTTCIGGTNTCNVVETENGRLQRGKDLAGNVISFEDKTILASSDPNFLTLAQRLIGQGVTGSGQEMGLEAARRAVSEPLISTPPTADPPGNQGFLRPGARLLVIIVSDEDDCSDARDCSDPASRLAVSGSCGGDCEVDADCLPAEASYCLLTVPNDPSQPRRCSPNACETAAGRAQLEPVSTYVDFFKSLDDGTGTGRKREFFLAVIGAVDSSLTPARCIGGGDEAYGIAVRYKQMVDMLGPDNALIDSLCKDDYAEALTRIARLVNAPQTLDLEKAPADPRLVTFDVTREDGTTVTCKHGEGFDYDPPAGAAKARVTFKGPCHLRNGDTLKMKVFCAG